MRILIANWNRNVVGGAEKYLQALLPELVSRGHEIGMIHEIPVSGDREKIDAPERALPVWDVEGMGLAAALESLDAWRPDVVYSHGLESPALEAALIRKYPTVLFAHNYYGTCGTGSKTHSFPDVRPCSRRFGPMCLVLHYPRRCGGLDPLRTWRLFQRQAERSAELPHCRAIVVASSHMYQEYLRHGLPAERIHLIPLPSTDIRPESLSPRPLNSDRRILLMGRLTALKGGAYLIQAARLAAAKVGPLCLTILGDGPERRNLEDLARKFNVNAEFLNWAGTAEKLQVMRQSDLIAVPSLWPEPFGLGGIEAGCVGLPAVGFAAGGIVDWLIPGHSGEIAPADPPTAEGLAAAIVRALIDSEHYAALRRGAWDVANRFTMEAHVEKLELVLTASQPGFGAMAGIHAGTHSN